MKTTDISSLILESRCPMCNAKNDELQKSGINFIVHCRYCRREYRIYKTAIIKSIRHWKTFVNGQGEKS